MFPAELAPEGGQELELFGTSLGTSGQVTLGGQACVVTAGGWSHTSVRCTTPPYAGDDPTVAVIVSVAGQASNSVPVTYQLAPRIRVVEAAVMFTPTNIGQPATAPLVVANDGWRDLVVSGLVTSGAHASDFAAVDVPPVVVAPGDQVALTLAFTPLGRASKWRSHSRR
ncbi:MAG: IPT/TIG domain-containing protein [Vicinamibacterales bacterium]|nr:IPT/TIG domain-containing protein [Vicinamibacterales bacterium]